MASHPFFRRRRIVTKRIGEILLEQEIITQQQLEAALLYQEAHGGLLGQILIERGYAAEQEMEEAIVITLSTQYGFPYLPLEHYEIDYAVLELIPEHVARHYCLIPINRIGNGLTIAMADPSNTQAVEHLESLTNCVIQTLVSTPSEIRKAIELYYPRLKFLTRRQSYRDVSASSIAELSANRPTADRRRAPRIVSRLRLMLAHQERILAAMTNDLSATGMSCTVEENVSSTGGTVEIKLELPSTLCPVQIACQGRVVRIEQPAGAPHATVAIAFSELSERDRQALAQYTAADQAGRAKVHERGYGFIAIFMMQIVVFLSLISSTLMLRSLHNAGLSRVSMAQDQSLALAEAAVDRAIDTLGVPPLPSTSFLIPADGSISLADGTYSARIIAPGPEPDGDPTLLPLERRIIGHGTQGGAQREVEVITSLTPVSVFGDALFADQSLRLAGTVDTDSYDSRLGDYGEQLLDADGNPIYDANGNPVTNEGSDGDIGTNGTGDGDVRISGDVTIDGGVATGAGSDPDAVINTDGATYEITADPDATALAEPMPLPPVIIPTGLVCTELVISASQTVTLPAGDYCFTTLQITGGDTIATRAALIPDGSGPVNVYIASSFAASGNALIGLEGNPTQFMLQIASPYEATVPDAKIAGTAQFYGGLYAPDATVAIRGTADIYGSVVANQIVVTGTAFIHYDEAMKDSEGPISEYTANILYWRDRDLSEMPGA